MILAAAACAEGKGPPPPELDLAWQAESWQALPEDGGLRNQIAGELSRMAVALNVYRAVKGWKSSAVWAQWAKDNPQSWEMVQMVLELRKDGRDKHD